MPGFMGLRGLEIKTQHEFERERREERRNREARSPDVERRSREKVQEILREQTSDTAQVVQERHLSAKRGAECEEIAHAKITEIMSGRVAVLTYDDTLLTVNGIFSSVRFHHLPVVDEEGGIIGIVSDRDFLRLASPFLGTINEQTRDKEMLTKKVGTVMTRNPICVGTEAEIVDAVRIMNSRRISCLPVLDATSGKLMGIITWKDIVRAFVPQAFDSTRDSNRLKTGVHINPKSTESQRLKRKEAESARLRAVADSRRFGDTRKIITPDEKAGEKDRAPGQQAKKAQPSAPPASERIMLPESARKKKVAGETEIVKGPPFDMDRMDIKGTSKNH